MAIKRVYSASYPNGTPAKNRFSILDNKLKELKRQVCIQNGRIINPENGKDAYEDQSSMWGTFDNACKYIDIDKEKDCVLGCQLGKDYLSIFVKKVGRYRKKKCSGDSGTRERLYNGS